MKIRYIDPRRIKLYKTKDIRPGLRNTPQCLLQSIRKNGILTPLMLSGGLRVIDGGCRLACALKLGIGRVPCVVLSGPEVKKRGSSVLLVGHGMPPGGLRLNKSTVRNINVILFGRAKV